MKIKKFLILMKVGQNTFRHLLTVFGVFSKFTNPHYFYERTQTQTRNVCLQIINVTRIRRTHTTLFFLKRTRLVITTAIVKTKILENFSFLLINIWNRHDGKMTYFRFKVLAKNRSLNMPHHMTIVASM